jgi:hypothetical protein
MKFIFETSLYLKLARGMSVLAFIRKEEQGEG